MADNVTLPGTDEIVAADEVSGAKYQRVKLAQGADGSATDVSSAAPLQVSLANHGANSTAVKVDGSAVTQPASLASAAVASGAFASGSVASGAFASGSIASGAVVDGAVVTLGAKADAKSTATDTTSISAMSVWKQISASVQAIASAIAGTLTVSGTVTANAGTGNHAITAASGAIASGAVASGAVASGAFATGSIGSGAVASGAVASGAFASGALASGSIAAGAIAAGATSIADNEDVGAADGDRGVKVLVRRSNTASSSSGSDGDYQFPITNTRGALWMAIEDGAGGQVTSFSGPTQYTEDAAAASDPVGSMMMAVRRDTLATNEVTADGDNIALKASNKGKLHVAAEVRLGDTVADVGAGTGGSATQRVIVDSSQFSALGQTTMSASQPVAVASNQSTISVAQDTSLVTNGVSGTTLVPKFAKVTASSSGLNVVVAAVVSKKIRVVSAKLVANAAVNAKWQSQAASPDVQTDLTGLSYFGAQGDGEVLGYNPVGWFQSASGEGLTLNLSGSVAVGGHITYVEV